MDRIWGTYGVLLGDVSGTFNKTLVLDIPESQIPSGMDDRCPFLISCSPCASAVVCSWLLEF
jgi:hypothetical protein